MSALTLSQKISLSTQKTVAWLTMPLWYYGSLVYMRCIQGYRIQNQCQIRQQFKNILAEQKKPLLICANHLTKIDSLIMQWGLGSFCTYAKNFKAFAWNLPERDRVKDNALFRFICYVGCCIPISRGGSREVVNRSLNKIKDLLENHHIAMIFPEGKRSTTGRVETEEFAYGVGRLLQTIQDCEVLCVYLRGEGQDQKSNFPQKNENFYMSLKKIAPKSDAKGLRANRDISQQIIQQLATMEEDYFASRRQ